MQTLLLFVYVVVAVCLIALVLIQRGKGADIGAAFGSGASQTVFGSSGSGSFLVKLTAVLAALFFIICIVLNYMVVHQARHANTVGMNIPVSQQMTTSAPKTNSIDAHKTNTTKK